MPINGFLIFSLCYLYFSSLAFCKDCPKEWVSHRESCYKFIRSPLNAFESARSKCRTYNSDLVSVNSFMEHEFISSWLKEHDPQHYRWYTSGISDDDNSWIWEGDNTKFSNIDLLLNPLNELGYGRRVVYNYSTSANKWGLSRVLPQEELPYICEIPLEDLDNIILMERDISYGVLVTDEEKVPRGPYFIEEPKSVIFAQSDRDNVATLRCVAKGYPPPTYIWYQVEYHHDEMVSKKIDPLSDYRYTQTDGILMILDPDQSTDKGKYYCSATNKFGTIISQIVSLDFGTIPEFNRKRSAEYGKENWGKSISCDPPQVYPRVNYYWNRNKFPNFVEEDQRVFASFDGNLYFSSLEKTDQANYSCAVQSVIAPAGRTGPFFQLIVGPASSGQKLQFPNTFPKAFPDTPLVGDDVRLECVAYGYPVPSYNWTRTGSTNRLPEGARLENYNRVLKIPAIKVEDMGDYICTAYNYVESIRKSTPLRIQAYPSFTVYLDDKIMDASSSLTWTCEAFGIPDVKYSWYKNGEELNIRTLKPGDVNRYRIYENILRIDQVYERDQGMYQCKATNQLGSAYSSGQLKILSLAPSFEKYPLETEMYAAEGGNFTIPCRPEAAPFPTFEWRRDNQILTSGRYQILDNGYLYIGSVSLLDEGMYTCIAKNSHGNARSSGNLIVLSFPSLRESPTSKLAAVVNSDLTLKCEARTNLLLDVAYVWLQNGLRIDFLKQQQYSVGENLGYLNIHNISFAEAGAYTCIVKTSVGRINTSTELIVIGPPGAPGAVLAEELNNTSGVVHWSDGADNGRRIYRYIVEGYTEHNKTWVVLTNVSIDRTLVNRENGRRKLQLIGVLSPWSTYHFRVSAMNEFGQGSPSKESPAYNTANDIPYVAPLNVGGGGGKVGSLTITWDPIPPKDWNAPNIWYKIYYKKLEENVEYYKKDLKQYGNIGMYTVNVGEENYYLEYTVRVQAINDVGPGPISDEVVIFSAEKMPQVQPSQVKALPFNSTALNVSWEPLDLTREKIRGKLSGHRIKYWKKDDNPETDSLILLNRGMTPWGLIVGLQPNTEYWVAVMAYNDAGSGIESEKFLARTYKAAPLRPPTNVEVKAVSPTVVAVKWRGILTSTEEEPIMGYKVRYWEADRDLTTAKEVVRYLDGEDLETVVPNLVSGKTYKLRVLAFSLGGDGKMSSPPWEFYVADGIAQSYLGRRAGAERPNLEFFILFTIVLTKYFIINS
ncbi:contactin-like [Centruroides sculpturatus]|uniref:contactin-like n=1 Tax=Centruroides sculpturatus TaxID=218467 RepID=UPI000C6C9A05|nr:contactin-like [Centruroides sculpturatus]